MNIWLLVMEGRRCTGLLSITGYTTWDYLIEGLNDLAQSQHHRIGDLVSTNTEDDEMDGTIWKFADGTRVTATQIQVVGTPDTIDFG